MYTNNNANFFDNGNTTTKSTTKPPSSDYSKWIMPTSNGLTYKALNLLSDSVRGYVYLLLSAQSGARRNIMDSPAARQIYLDNFNDIVERQVETAADIERYQHVLRYARSKVDFGIAEDVYMIPSNMLLKIGNIEGYNNKLLIADSNVKIDMVNIDINQKSIEKETRPKHDSRKQLPQETSSKSKNPHNDELLSENEKKNIKRTCRGKRSLNNRWYIINNCRYIFFQVNYASFFILTSLNNRETIKPTNNTINNHTCCATNPTAFFKKFETPEITEPNKPGRAAATFPASFPSRRANACNLFLSQLTTLLLSLGGLPPPPEPVEIPRAFLIAKIIVDIIVATAVNNAIIIMLGSFKIVFIFSPNVVITI